ncbi:hypothetical protein ACJJTC_018015 [Scirpophaga incertulas]
MMLISSSTLQVTIGNPPCFNKERMQYGMKPPPPPSCTAFRLRTLVAAYHNPRVVQAQLVRLRKSTLARSLPDHLFIRFINHRLKIGDVYAAQGEEAESREGPAETAQPKENGHNVRATFNNLSGGFSVFFEFWPHVPKDAKVPGKLRGRPGTKGFKAVEGCGPLGAVQFRLGPPRFRMIEVPGKDEPASPSGVFRKRANCSPIIGKWPKGRAGLPSFLKRDLGLPLCGGLRGGRRAGSGNASVKRPPARNSGRPPRGKKPKFRRPYQPLSFPGWLNHSFFESFVFYLLGSRGKDLEFGYHEQLFNLMLQFICP